MANRKALLIEWENYEKGEPFCVQVLSLSQARARANAFKQRRRRRADVIRLSDIRPR